jgi:hypothetical protein
MIDLDACECIMDSDVGIWLLFFSISREIIAATASSSSGPMFESSSSSSSTLVVDT